MSKKEELEKWLDDMIVAHELIWENDNFVYENENTGVYMGRPKKVLLLYGVVKIGEILGCCVKFAPSRGAMRVSIDYKGVELVEHIFG